MAGRFTDWFRTRATAASTEAQAYGAKLLDFLREERARPGAPQTMKVRRTMSDGTVVTAQFDGSQPTVTIKGPGGKGPSKRLELYMESGLLELSLDAEADTFTQPVIPDGDATLYCVDSTPCGKEYPLGMLRLTLDAGGKAVGASANCMFVTNHTPLSKAVATVTEGTFAATRAEKLTAQARLPRTLWTGLMRRYVSALYGSKAAYKAAGTDPVLRIPCRSEVLGYIDVDYRWGATWGLIDPAGTGAYRFVVASASAVVVRSTTFFDPAAEALVPLWRSMPVVTLAQRKRKARLEAYILSCLRVGPVVQTLTMTTATGAPLAYGWKFNPRGTQMAVVGWDLPNTTLYKRNLSVSAGVIALAAADESSAAFHGTADLTYAGQIYAPDAGNRSSSLKTLPSSSAFPADWDCAAYCYYQELEPNALTVLRSKLVAGALGDAEVAVAGACSYEIFIQTQTFSAGFYISASEYMFTSKVGLDGGAMVLNCDDRSATWATPPFTYEYLRVVRRDFKAAMLVIPADHAGAATVRVREYERNQYTSAATDPINGALTGAIDNFTGQLHCFGMSDMLIGSTTSSFSPDEQACAITGATATTTSRAPPCVSIPITGPVAGENTVFNTYQFTPSTPMRWKDVDFTGVPAYYGLNTTTYVQSPYNPLMSPSVSSTDRATLPTHYRVFVPLLPSGSTEHAFINPSYVGWA